MWSPAIRLLGEESKVEDQRTATFTNLLVVSYFPILKSLSNCQEFVQYKSFLNYLIEFVKSLSKVCQEFQKACLIYVSSF